MRRNQLFLMLAAVGFVLAVQPGSAPLAQAPVVKGDAVKAEAIYKEGVAAENKKDMKAAVEKYLAAARIGHAAADIRLGQLYDKDVTKTLPHDLQDSIRHYQNARKSGREIKGPPSRAPNPTN